MLGDWPGLLQGVLGAAVVVAIAWGSLQRGTIQGLRGDNDDLRKRLEDRDETLAEERAKAEDQRKADRTEIDRLSGDVRTLQAVVTGEAHLVALEGGLTDLANALHAHHGDAMGGLQRLEEAIERLTTAVRGDGP